MRILGLDVGERRIGVAISDPDQRLAVPLRVIDRKGEDGLAAIADLARREEVGTVVVGLPVTMEGAVGAQAESVEHYAAALRAHTNAEVVLYDERLSSVEADRQLRAAGLNSRAAKERRDAVAASIVLQAYLDSRRAPPLPPIQ